jgi:hypothetical protein
MGPPGASNNPYPPASQKKQLTRQKHDSNRNDSNGAHKNTPLHHGDVLWPCGPALLRSYSTDSAA